MFYYLRSLSFCKFGWVVMAVAKSKISRNKEILRIQEPDTALIDTLPEDGDYMDEGCELGESCLKCPFPECLYDIPRGKDRVARERRDRAILELHRRGRVSRPDLAERFELSERTIERITSKRRTKQCRK